MNWGKWIIVAFVLFAAFIGTLVAICVRQDISLVSKNYYQEELAYQAQLDRLNNTGKLAVKPSITLQGKMLAVSIADFSKVEEGELVLFSPSDARRDRRFPITATDEAVARFNVSDAAKGMYRAKLSWKMNGREFYLEQVINI